MNRVDDATPLIAVSAVALDLETTGLDVAEARVVQIGGVGLERGRCRRDDLFETLVDPGVPVPARSTAIHGITNHMLRTAPAFPEAWRRFEQFRRKRLVIGYALGFDYAVLAREMALAGLLWQPPRRLCVRLLAQLANPDLPELSLDAIAAWLGVETKARHSAAGDAVIAAEIYSALVPLLIGRNIRTVAEAERASARISQAVRRHAAAGWSEPEQPEERSPAGALAAIDPYAFHHRVAEALGGPPAIAKEDIPLLEAVRLMSTRRISSLLLEPEGRPGLPIAHYAILTERDVTRAIAADGAAALRGPAIAIAARPVVSVASSAFFHQALGLLDRHRIRHLAVADDSGRLVGVVSARDFLRFRASAAVDLHATIAEADSPADLAAAWSRLPVVAASLLREDIDAGIITQIVSDILAAITSRAADLALGEMREAGKGGPPCRFAVMVLGSAGRSESLLAADQDNALVFEEGEPDGQADRWFARFGELFTGHLHEAGIPLCRGGVMARNGAWRGSVATWRDRIDTWVTRPRPQDMLNVDIFFDLRPAHGAFDMAQALRTHAWDLGSEHVAFAKLMGESVRDVADPFTLFGRLRTEGGRLDLKRHGLFPIAAFARALAIRHHLPRASTGDRLRALAEREGLPSRDLHALAEAHAFLLSVVLDQQAADTAAGIVLSNRVDLGRLSRRRLTTLKDALKTVRIVPDLVRTIMFA